MKYMSTVLVLLAATIATPTDTCAQARGPDAEYVQEYGQEILSRRQREELVVVQEATMDEATRALRIEAQDAWLRRLPGRYRIKGEVRLGQESGSVDGIADCSGVGNGPGVNCIINAQWPLLGGSNPMNVRPSAAEYLNTMRPSVLVFGMSLDPPRVVSQMVMGDSVVLDWSGRLEEDTLSQIPDHRCTDRCIGEFNVTASGSGLVTFNMLLFNPDIPRLDRPDDELANRITFRMERDPEARAEKPLRALQAR